MSEHSLARTPRTDTTEEQTVVERSPFLYPHPVQLARARALREPSAAAYGIVGGLTTLSRYGTGHYRLMALRRWGR